MRNREIRELGFLWGRGDKAIKKKQSNMSQTLQKIKTPLNIKDEMLLL
jgi:hypothetical protein